MEGTLGNYIHTLVTQTVEHGLPGPVGVHFFHHFHHTIVGGFTPDGQFLCFFLPAQKHAKGPVGLRGAFYRGINVDKRNAGLLRQIIHILLDRILGISYVDDHIGGNRQQSLQIHLTLAAVELADFRQGGEIVRQIQSLVFSIGAGDTHQQVTSQGNHVHLTQRTRDGDFGDFRRNRNGSAGGVGELPGTGSGFRRSGGDGGGLGLSRGGGFCWRRGGAACQHQAQDEQQTQNRAFHVVTS